MHYNENGMRDQAVNKDGQQQFTLCTQSSRKVDIYTVREVIHVIGCTYSM